MKILIYAEKENKGKYTAESERLIEEVQSVVSEYNRTSPARAVNVEIRVPEREEYSGETLNGRTKEMPGKEEELKNKTEKDIRENASAEERIVAVFASNERNRELTAGLAVKLGVNAVQDCLGFRFSEKGELHWLKPVFDNALIAELNLSGREADVSGLQIATIKVAGASDGNLWSEDMPIDDAEIVVCVGRGCGEGEGLRLARELAEVLGAALGATRAVTDAHTLPISKQIGQTGKYIRPRVYIGVGVAGAIQHLAGMRNSDVIIAINKDARAPIFEYADYGIVGDLYEVLPRMIESLKEKSR